MTFQGVTSTFDYFPGVSLVEKFPLLPYCHPSLHSPLELFGPDWHLQAMEWVLHDEIRVKLMTFLQDDLGISLCRFCEQQEFCPGNRLVTAYKKA